MNRQLRERLKCERTEAQDQQPLGRETGRGERPAGLQNPRLAWLPSGPAARRQVSRGHGPVWLGTCSRVL